MVLYIFVFYSANMEYYSNWCSVIKPTLHSLHKFHLVTVCHFLYVLLGQFANILLSSFVFLYKMNIGMLFSFLEMYLSGFGTRVILASTNRLLIDSPSFSFFWKNLGRIDIIYSLENRIYHQGTEFFFVGIF